MQMSVGGQFVQLSKSGTPATFGGWWYLSGLLTGWFTRLMGFFDYVVKTL